jgi:hypothetical protein
MNAEEKTIFRIVKDKENPFVMMDRRVLENLQMSWKAKGLLAYLLSRPDNWEINMGDLVNRSTDGEHSTRGALDELLIAGHVVRDIERDDQKRFVRFVFKVYEKPVDAELRTLPKSRKPVGENQEMAVEEPPAEPFGDFPQMGFPQVENLPLNNTNNTNTDLTNINFGADAQNDTPEVPPAWGIGWQLAADQPVKLPTEEEKADARMTNACNLFYEHERPFVLEFINATGIFPVKDDVAFWRKSITYLKAKGVIPAAIGLAAKQAYKDDMTVSSPNSLVKYAVDLNNKAKMQTTKQAAAPAQVKTPFELFLDGLESGIQPGMRREMPEALRQKLYGNQNRPAA